MNRLVELFAVVSLACGPALAQSICSTHTIRGNWGVTCTGNLTPAANAPLTPTRILGTCTSTLEGEFQCEGTMSLGGIILAQTMSGKAIVNENCTGSIRYTQTLDGNPAPDMNIRFLIFDSGKLIDGLPVDKGANLACTLKRM
jgi:hypothetical protein